MSILALASVSLHESPTRRPRVSGPASSVELERSERLRLLTHPREASAAPGSKKRATSNSRWVSGAGGSESRKRLP